ncbi:hypothetical protein QYF36_025876 [Acer negundo]|nr:hypothetical protein QYF36_025876 [Acer negundo]
MNHQLPIESQFVSKLADQLNAEIVLGTVQNAKEACNWIAYTYLYIRKLRNPSLYGLPPEVLKEDVTLEERRADMFFQSLLSLESSYLSRKSLYFYHTLGSNILGCDQEYSFCVHVKDSANPYEDGMRE